MIFAIVTYSFILRKIKISRRRFRLNGSIHRFPMRKEFLVPGLIILTFPLLYYFPYVAYHFIYKQLDRNRTSMERRSHSVGFAICDLLPSFAYGADALTYIVFTKQYRSIVKNMFSCLRRHSSAIPERTVPVQVAETVL